MKHASHGHEQTLYHTQNLHKNNMIKHIIYTKSNAWSLNYQKSFSWGNNAAISIYTNKTHTLNAASKSKIFYNYTIMPTDSMAWENNQTNSK